MNVYVVIGTRENVYQERIGGEFAAHPDKEIVKIFSNEIAANDFVKNCKLKQPTRKPYGDTSYYKNGFYDLEIETHTVEL